jgi:hypothetical protein
MLNSQTGKAFESQCPGTIPGFNYGLEGYAQWSREAHVRWCQNRFLGWAETKERRIRTLPFNCQLSIADDNVRLWMVNHPLSIAWNDLGLSDPEAPYRKNFMVACAFFFIPELPSKFAEVNNALHKHWLTKFKAPMQASGLMKRRWISTSRNPTGLRRISSS